MDFKRRSVKGKSRKFYKLWLDETRQYRITWTREVFGVRVPPHFYACVRIILPDGREMWDFVGRRGPYKTFKKAAEECEAHAEQKAKGKTTRKSRKKAPEQANGPDPQDAS